MCRTVNLQMSSYSTTKTGYTQLHKGTGNPPVIKRANDHNHPGWCKFSQSPQTIRWCRPRWVQEIFTPRTIGQWTSSWTTQVRNWYCNHQFKKAWTCGKSRTYNQEDKILVSLSIKNMDLPWCVWLHTQGGLNQPLPQRETIIPHRSRNLYSIDIGTIPAVSIKCHTKVLHICGISHPK